MLCTQANTFLSSLSSLSLSPKTNKKRVRNTKNKEKKTVCKMKIKAAAARPKASCERVQLQHGGRMYNSSMGGKMRRRVRHTAYEYEYDQIKKDTLNQNKNREETR